MDLKALIDKYSISGPRYTSYPTAPHWSEKMGEKEHHEALTRVSATQIASIYVHIPFCESLCLYCGCNISLTRDHSKSSRYVAALGTEMERQASYLGQRLKIGQVAWGGGTPTFLEPSHIERLVQFLTQNFDLESNAEVSIEIDPRVTTEDHLVTLRRLGFNRVSLGVQDFDANVQKIVNRIQSPQMTEAMLKRCRELGYSGINYDLIYGLPKQSFETFSKTIQEVIRHRPDRIALYNYAHLPELRPHQKVLDKWDRPDANLRTTLFEMAYEALIAEGYVAIGMDHFARPTDELAKALPERSLYRNFQGYTVKRGMPLLGFGASAISEFDDFYFQNVRDVKTYQEKIQQGTLATQRGTSLSENDRRHKWVIQKLMCHFGFSFGEYKDSFGGEFQGDFSKQCEKLKTLEADGLLSVKETEIRVTDLGRLFVRVAAMLFDDYLGATGSYSKTV